MTVHLSTISEAEPLTARAAARIRSAILSGEIPAGERLSVPELARRLGISRTPAREALLVLERDGLVESRPRLGVVVLSGNADDLRQLFDLRETLDGMAARLAAANLDETGRGALRRVIDGHAQAVAAQALEAHVALDTEFHALLRDGAGNTYLAESLLRIERRLTVLMRMFSVLPRAMGPGVLRDHRAISDAVLAGDGAAAETAARRHVRNVWKFYRQSLGDLSVTREKETAS